MEKEETIYPSKIDWWIGLIMIGAPFIHLPLGVWMMTKGMTLFGFILIFWGLIIAGIIAALSYPCRYIVSDNHLTIRSGMVTDSFALSRITDVQPTKSMIASPALSLDRIELSLSDGTKRIISPSNQAEFIDQVKNALPKDSQH